MTRSELLDALAARIAQTQRPHPIRVGIDGVDGAGKTTLADELLEPLGRSKRQLIRASIDSFHNPRRIRYRRGRNSPEGYFHDSFDLAALSSSLLVPLGPGGTLQYRRAIFDYRTDSKVTLPIETAEPTAILLLDGIFLHQPALLPHWDFTIFLDTDFEISIRRTAERSGGSAEAASEENRRYVEGQRLYLAACDPKKLATLVVENNDLESPSFSPRSDERGR